MTITWSSKFKEHRLSERNASNWPSNRGKHGANHLGTKKTTLRQPIGGDLEAPHAGVDAGAVPRTAHLRSYEEESIPKGASQPGQQKKRFQNGQTWVVNLSRTWGEALYHRVGPRFGARPQDMTHVDHVEHPPPFFTKINQGTKVSHTGSF